MASTPSRRSWCPWYVITTHALTCGEKVSHGRLTLCLPSLSQVSVQKELEDVAALIEETAGDHMAKLGKTIDYRVRQTCHLSA